MPLIQQLRGSAKVNRVRIFSGLPRKQNCDRTLIMSGEDVGCFLFEALALFLVVENIPLFEDHSNLPDTRSRLFNP